MEDEWVQWHRQYGEPGSLARRLEIVQAHIREVLDRAPPGPVPVVSLCSGDGRDLLGVLAHHPRAPDVRARLIDISAELVDSGRAQAERLRLPGVTFVRGDASVTDALEGAVPGYLVLACGIWGNVSDEDVRSMIHHLPELCTPNATVVWTRGTFAPDLTPSIRAWFRTAGFEEIDFSTIPDSTAAVGAHRLTSTPRPLRRGVRLFHFLPPDERPSSLAPSTE